MEKANDPILAELGRRLTRYDNSVDVLKTDLIDRYAPLLLLLEDNLRGRYQRNDLMLPELRRDGNVSIGICTDYSGESSDSRFLTYSFLVYGWNHAFYFREYIDRVRKLYKLGDRTEMSYKDVGEGRRARCLKEYLLATDYIAGLLLTIVVDKRIKSLFGIGGEGTDTFLVDALKDAGYGNRRPKVAENFFG